MNILYSEAINTVKTFKGNTVTTYKGNTVMTSKGYCHLKAIFLIPQVQVWFRGNCYPLVAPLSRSVYVLTNHLKTVT